MLVPENDSYYPESRQFPLHPPSCYRLRYDRTIDLTIRNPYTAIRQQICIRPNGTRYKHGVIVASEGLVLSFTELAFLYDKANYGYKAGQIAGRYGESPESVNNTIEHAAVRNGLRGKEGGVVQVTIAAEKRGLLHPDLMPYIRDTLLTKRPQNPYYFKKR